MGNAALGTIVNAGAQPFGVGKGSTLCKAYVLGLQRWCADIAKKPRGDFNNYVFKALKDVEPDGKDIFAALDPRRELPVGAIVAGRGFGVRGFANMAAGSGALAAPALRALELVAEAIAAGGMSGAAAGSWVFRKVAAASVRSEFAGATLKRVLCPDALQPNGRPLEIKRPNEPQSHNNQIDNYKKASPDGKCDILDCTSCANGTCPSSGDCPAPAS